MNKQQILDIAKDRGIELGEDMAIAAAKTAIDLLRIIVPQVSRGAGTMLNLFLDAYEFRIYELLDEIDGKKDLATE